MNGKLLTKEVRKLFKRYMLNNDIDTFKGLAKETGIDYQTLLDHLTRPELFRVYELKALDEVLHFSSEDLLFLIYWKKLNMEVSA
jgi:hypothetical protein